MAAKSEPLLSDNPANLSTTRSAEEHAIDFLLSEGRSATFHAREEKIKTGNDTSNVVVAIDGGTEYKYKQVETKDTSVRLDGMHLSRQIDRYFMSGLHAASTSATAKAGLFDLLPFIPLDMKITANSSTMHADGGDWSMALNCTTPRYDGDANCTGILANSDGQIVASARALFKDGGDSKLQLFSTKGRYLGEINQVTIKDPTGNVTTTDITAHR